MKIQKKRYLAKRKQRGGMETENENNCPICLEKLDGTENITLSCTHIFHKSCMINWCEGKVMCYCPLCRTDLIDNDILNLGLGEEVFLRKTQEFIAYHVENIRDSLARNYIPPIPSELQTLIQDVVYREGGPRERFLNMILIFMEIYTRKFNENIRLMRNETDFPIFVMGAILIESVEFVHEYISLIIETINDEFTYEDNTLYAEVKKIMRMIINFIDRKTMKSISDPNSPYYGVITFI